MGSIEQAAILTLLVPLFQGKGRMMTYWLVGKDNYDKVLPAFDEKDDEK